MTLIIGIETPQGVVMAADKSAISGYSQYNTRLPKVFRVNGDIMLAYTTSFRMGQLLQYRLPQLIAEPYIPEEYDSPFEYLVKDVVEAIREAFADGGVLTVENNVTTGGSILIGLAGKIYTIYDDFQVNSPSNGFAAMGAGSEIAMGVMGALEGRPVDQIIETAFRVTATYCSAVTPNYDVLYEWKTA